MVQFSTNSKMYLNSLMTVLTMFLLSNIGYSAESKFNNITQQLDEIKQILIAPKQNQFAVLLSLKVEDTFKLDSVSLSMNNKQIKTYLYTSNENTVLKKGGVQKIYIGDLKSGNHRLTANLIASDSTNTPFKITTELNFEKSDSATFIELLISKSKQQELPDFTLNVRE